MVDLTLNISSVRTTFNASKICEHIASNLHNLQRLLIHNCDMFTGLEVSNIFKNCPELIYVVIKFLTHLVK